MTLPTTNNMIWENTTTFSIFTHTMKNRNVDTYIRLEDNTYPLYRGNIQSNYKLGDEFILPEGYVQVNWIDPPVYDEKTQIPYVIEPKKLYLDYWVMQWAVRDLTPEEIEMKKDFDKRHKKKV
jgi:hypothetical protein